MHYLNNKRHYVAQRHDPRWAHPTNYGYEISEYQADQVKLHKKSLLPLDFKPLQEKPFLRPGRASEPFSKTIGSVI